ncbi:MAG: hypothetical protein J0L84_06540 [Verrucomicrobia bacterium]|nr:hypothetical protein [Verrucomicrobiota bacterium]
MKLQDRKEILHVAQANANAEVRLICAIAWNVQNQQNMLKVMGQAFASGAIGLPAPFLVKQADLCGNLAVLLLLREKLIVLKSEIVSMIGSDIQRPVVSDAVIQSIIENNDLWNGALNFPTSQSNLIINDCINTSIIIGVEIDDAKLECMHSGTCLDQVRDMVSVVKEPNILSPRELIFDLAFNSPSRGEQRFISDAPESKDLTVSELEKLSFEELKLVINGSVCRDKRIRDFILAFVKERSKGGLEFFPWLMIALCVGLVIASFLFEKTSSIQTPKFFINNVIWFRTIGLFGLPIIVIFWLEPAINSREYRKLLKLIAGGRDEIAK